MRSIVFARLLRHPLAERLMEAFSVEEYAAPRRGHRRSALLDVSTLDPNLPRNSAAPRAEQAWKADEELVRAVLAGDRDALEALCRRLACLARILAAINACHGAALDADELADLAQDGSVIVWRKLSTFNGRSTLETWIYGIALLEYRNALRRRQRTPMPAGATFEDDRAEPGPHDTEDLEESSRLLSALEDLDAQDRRILLERIVDEQDFEVIARGMRSSSGAVKARYYRALARLQQRFASGPHGQGRRGEAGA